jgi:2,5-diamino-6-(ribosylamino)-4(3H)-pyrimidinone 5'-phosphate reductase
MPRPYVVAHVAVSLDGATTGFAPRLAPFYDLVAAWSEDVTLVGADTILAQEAALAAARGPGPSPDGPLLAVVDSRGRVRRWSALRDAGHWSAVVALRCETSPAAASEPWLECLVCGVERVDLSRALEELARRGARTVRVDSGGTLLGALLDRGLVDELSLLVHPLVAGPEAKRWTATGRGGASDFAPISTDLVDGDLVWLRYRASATATSVTKW